MHLFSQRENKGNITKTTSHLFEVLNHAITYFDAVIDPGVLMGRSGPIQAAVNLELHSSRIKRIDVKLVGLNGQLPNLDMFNLVIELCLRESVHTTFHDQVRDSSCIHFCG